MFASLKQLLFFVVVFSVSLPVYAQADTIFAPSVEIISAQARHERIEEDERNIYLDNPDSLEDDVYPFPEGAGTIKSVWEYGRADGRWAVRPDFTSVEGVWLLDRATGEYEPYTPECEPDVVQLWVYYHDPVTDETHLCNTETGAMSRPLPKMHDDVTLDWPSQKMSLRRKGIEASPDGQWIVFFAENLADSSYGGAYIYVYNISDDSILYLDWLDDRIVRVDGWFGERVVITSRFETSSWYWNEYYSGSLIETESLRWMDERELGRSQQSYQWIEDDNHGACRLIRFDPFTGTQTEYPFEAQRCHTWLDGQPNGTYLYLDANRNADYVPLTQTLVQWNPLIGERIEIFTDEIERYMGTSPDGRYAVLIIGHNGQIDETAYIIDRIATFSPYIIPRPEMIVVDVTTHERVYGLGVSWQGGDYWYRWLLSGWAIRPDAFSSDGGSDISIVPIGENRFTVTNNMCRLYEDLCQDTLVTITDGSIEEIDLPGQANFVLPECDVLLVEGENKQYTVYDMLSGEFEPLYQSSADEMHISWVVDGRYVEVSGLGMTYTIAPHPRCLA